MTDQLNPITQKRIDELAAMLSDGTASEEAEREIWNAARIVPQLVCLLRAYMNHFDAARDIIEDADDLSRDARSLIAAE